MNPDPKEAVKTPAQEREERILKYWNEHEVFKKSVEREAPQGDFVFYDGPPFATGLPHFGHVLPTSIKDAVPRYKTMRGYRVRRRWGWDCHGLPVENLIEKELGLNSKKDIINYGIQKFNAAARGAVHRYVDDWKEIIPRLGRWADMENDYETMNPSYTESVWWAFKELHNKGLVYEGFKIMQICPHDETTLSNFEVAQGYKDIKDVSVYVKFKLKRQSTKGKSENGNTYLLAWTTTPWTLPGNVALAVGKDIEYVKVKVKSEFYIIAKERLAATFKKEEYEIVETMNGSDLVGKSYEPLFDYYSNDTSLKNRENGWKIYAADFVTTTDGTGIVHIAPAFGADDYALGQSEGLPFVQHVNIDGTFKAEAKDFAGLKVKPKDTDEDKEAHIRTDIKVIQFLQDNGLFFAKENLVHSYPHCWRCGTPLLNYAASSWFVRVSDITGKLVAENKKVNWVPPEVGEGRFGNWLLGAKDWAISRSRFWGAPIPVWRAVESEKLKMKSENGKTSPLPTANLSFLSGSEEKKASRREKATPEMIVIGSIAEMKKYSRAKNTYYVMRHGEAENNTLAVMSTKADDPKHLTEKGREQVKEAAMFFIGKNIDLILTSPFIRTKETADIIADTLHFPKKNVIIDDRLHELYAGTYHGRPFKEFVAAFPHEKRFSMRPTGGENYSDIRKRVGEFIYDMEAKYSGKNILIITHDVPAFLLESIALGLDDSSTIKRRDSNRLHYMNNAEPKVLDFSPLPHNDDQEIDLHRPFIDEIDLRLTTGEKLTRVEEVFDCWFESGSMPYGEAHYPFDTTEFKPAKGLLSKITGGNLGKSRGYPADFIAEGLDQTRGWFYSMLVLGTALFGRAPYKNVIVNGIILAEDGQKMSKSKNNFPDLLPVVNKYGADAIRYFLLSSPSVRAQEFCFSEKGTDEVAKKHIGRLLNVVSFYEMYQDQGKRQKAKSKNEDTESGSNIRVPETLDLRSFASHNILDQWILSRLNQLNKEVTEAMEKYELDKATRPFADFIDDMSTWYLRRSRDRFKGEDEEDKAAALSTTRSVLIELSKLLAPFMPFVSDEIYLKLEGGAESVHLEKWPTAGAIDADLLLKMKDVRKIASLGLEARSKAKINVRQPLQMLKAQSKRQDTGLLNLIKDEVNVKEIAFDENLPTAVELDLNITPALKEEGNVRELVRAIQDARKEKSLVISDKAKLAVSAEGQALDFVRKNEATIKKMTGLLSVAYHHSDGGDRNQIGDFSIGIEISV